LFLEIFFQQIVKKKLLLQYQLRELNMESKWKIKIKDGQIEVEGMNFKNNECVQDVIYQILKQKANITSEKRIKDFAMESEVVNIEYVEEK